MKSSTLSAFAADFRNHFDGVLAEHLEKTIAQMADVDSSGAAVAHVISDFVTNGGKRLRPLLVAIGYNAFSDRDWREVVQAGIATELFHAFFLIHDDLMDRSDLRRGAPTVHRVFAKTLQTSSVRRESNAEHIANSMAILAGDLCCALAYNALLTVPFPADRILRALQHMQRMVHATTIGQVLDIAPPNETSETLVTKIHLLKTAKYSVEAPLHLGMILADASSDDLAAMSSFALPVGLAYQIKDDLLGVFGTEEEVGKPITSDLQEGKETLLTVFTRAHGNEAQRSRLYKLHGKADLTEAELAEARAMFNACGAVKFSEDRALRLVAEGKAALKKMSIPSSSRRILGELADYVIGRKA